MKTSVLVTVLGLAVISVLCSASQDEEQDMYDELLSAVFEVNDELQSEARCGEKNDRCKTNQDCCSGFRCTKFRRCGRR
uniref:U23-theraphotoxin-Cg1a 1 n=1 Tax=Chilobrachys guangxiensis TaxID=278060 RepID=JZ20A_CHIGU|nr:RecName: Full=U23-theraphotoxin-Cg1a 1; Short=U23-TRTX-Cg1a; AltName: Full=Jingzhaotoxin-20; Short=JZTX-20; Flags: Precursor [Chilobrachys guangxiensis]ABY71719.1 cystine knot toxin [Chilobrachys guangxiensis]